MNIKYISITIITSIFLFNIIFDIAHAQQLNDQTDKDAVTQQQNTDDIDLDLFIKDIYSKEKFYNPIDKRDPFQPFLNVIEDDKEYTPDIDPLAPPIKRYKLNQFKLVGVFWLENIPQAMIIDPEKNTYMLGIGDEVGRHDGKIVEIRENGISVQEKKYFINSEGLKSIKLSKSILAFKE
ncbi:MAG: pilus assembly protein PilP [Thermodesulfobacteriota bacterium]